MSESAKAPHSSGAIFEGPNGHKYGYNPFSHTQHHPSPIQQKQLVVLSSQSSGIVNHFCAHCRLTFIDNNEFEHHNVEMHGHKKILTCTICTATFRRQDHLKRHMQSLHFNQKYCTCPVCKKDCKRQDILLKHIKRKHTTTTEIFHCRECEFQCNSHTELEKHECSHLLTERHICVHCNATFKRRDHMLRHVKSQHLNQSVVCPVCNQSYKRKDHVVRHVREKHKMGYLNGKLVTSQDMF
uniref:C2H2-type domain-containing protein n=1 Tax=Pectinophora gossypiella TaxID=13191 RepID=A0A1E1WJ08_PECGO